MKTVSQTRIEILQLIVNRLALYKTQSEFNSSPSEEAIQLETTHLNKRINKIKISLTCFKTSNNNTKSIRIKRTVTETQIELLKLIVNELQSYKTKREFSSSPSQVAIGLETTHFLKRIDKIKIKDASLKESKEAVFDKCVALDSLCGTLRESYSTVVEAIREATEQGTVTMHKRVDKFLGNFIIAIDKTEKMSNRSEKKLNAMIEKDYKKDGFKFNLYEFQDCYDPKTKTYTYPEDTDSGNDWDIVPPVNDWDIIYPK